MPEASQQGMLVIVSQRTINWRGNKCIRKIR